jgi:uncharacterized protein (TIGR02246 family)
MTDDAQTAIVGNRDVTAVLDRWKQGIADADLDTIAEAFTEDALFQGLRPSFSLGRDGVRDYYGSQAPGLTVEYRILHVRELAADTVIVYLHADFRLGSGAELATHITIVMSRGADGWLISHYHVSRVG